MRTFIALFFLTLSRVLVGQNTHQIIDATTGESIPFAHIMIFPIEGPDSVINYLSDKNGYFHTRLKTKSIFHISYVGYKTIADTIDKDSSVVFKLRPDVFNLETFVVTANCEPQMVDKSIYDIQVISKKNIDSKGANNLTELLNNELNIKINIDPALGAGMSLQGLSGEHIKFLVDGVPVVGRKNGNIDISQINLNNVDHIEIIEGPMSVIYGSNALAGVINIITKTGNQRKMSLYAGSYLESVGVYNFEAGIEKTFKKHNFKFGAARNFFDGFTLTPDDRSMGWKPKRQINSDLGYSFNSQKNKLRVDISFFDEVLQDKGNLMPPYYETAFDQYFLTRRGSFRTDFIRKFSASNSLNLLNSLSGYDWKKNTYLKDLTNLEQILTQSPDQHDTTTVLAYVGRGIFSNDHPERKLNYQVGYDLNYEEAFGKRIEDNSKSIGDYAGFVSLNYKGIKNLKLQPGVRWSYNTRYKAPLVYSLNALFNYKKLTTRASVAKGFRAPSIKELFLDFQDINHNIVGNPDLKAEHSININLSANYIFEKQNHSYSAKLTGYHNEVKNIITLAIKSGGAYSYTNLYRYITKGMDLSLKYSFYPRIKIDVSGGILGIMNDDGTSLILKKFLYSPAITANYEYFYQKAGIRMNLFYKFTGKLPQLAIDEDGNLFESFVQSYHNMEISFNRYFYKNRFKVVIGGKNLFNNTTLASTSVSQGSVHGGGGSIPIGWGRTYFISINYNFTKY